MEKIKSANTNFIFEKDINDVEKVGAAFENGNLDYLYVLDVNNNITGVCYLEDFCNSKDLIVEKEIPQMKDDFSDEQATARTEGSWPPGPKAPAAPSFTTLR